MLQGCGTALVTPFMSDGALDEPALRVLVDWQIRSGVDFLIPCGTTGEASTLSEAETLRVAELVVETAAGRVPVFAGCTHNSTAEVVRRARELARVPGLTGLLSANPYYNRPGQEGQFQHFRALAEATELPVLLYNIPGRTAANLEPTTVARLAAVPNIVGVKESSGSVMQITDVLLSVPRDFAVLAGDDAMALPTIGLGGVGVVSVASNAFPRPVSGMVKAALRGDWKSARMTNLQFFRIMQAHFLETSPAPIKAVLAMLGVCGETLRLPMVPVTDGLRAKLRTLLDELRAAGEVLDEHAAAVGGMR